MTTPSTDMVEEMREAIDAAFATQMGSIGMTRAARVVAQAAASIAQRRVERYEAALAQANVDILTTLGAVRDNMPAEAVAIFQRIAKDCAALNSKADG